MDMSKKMPRKLVLFLDMYDAELPNHETYKGAFEAAGNKFEERTGLTAYKDYNSFTGTLRHYKKKD